jgi:hypothetical protein
MKLKVRSHTGKIGHLPYEIRCQLGRGIHNGIPGARLVTWLNSLPEVQAVLRQDFGGRPINQQNFSKWKIHGYPDWLQEQVFTQVTKDILVKQIEKKGLPPPLNEISTGQSSI